jgi:hypothetical protein
MIDASFLRERILKSNPESNQKYKSKCESKDQPADPDWGAGRDRFDLNFLDIPHHRE